MKKFSIISGALVLVLTCAALAFNSSSEPSGNNEGIIETKGLAKSDSLRTFPAPRSKADLPMVLNKPRP